VQSNLAKAAVGIGAIALIVVLFVVLNGGSDKSKSSNTATSAQQTGATGTKSSGALAKPQTLLVQNAKPAGGIKKLTYNKGDRVRFVVDSDTADEIHVHGYNFKKDVPAGGKVSFDFPATIDGIFVIELENHRQQIAQLRVNP